MSENIIITLINKVFDLLLNVISIFRKSSKKDTLPKLTSHYIFYRMDMLLNHVKTNFELENKAKQLAFTFLLEQIIKTYKNNLYKLAQTIDKNEINSTDELLNLNIKVFNDTLDDYSTFYLNSYFSHEEQQVLYTVVTLFNRWHGNRINYIQESIEHVCTSKFYGTDVRIRQSVIFDLYIGVFVDMISDAESALNDLNGNLKGYTFKGYTF